jgi:hypothetical protein
MLREAQIPFLLWLPAALIFHLAGGGSAVEVAKVMSGQAEILAFARGVRSDVRSTLRITVDILDETPSDEEPEPEKSEADPEKDDAEEDDPEAEEAEKKLEPPKPKIVPKHVPKAPAPKPEEKKPEPKPEEKAPEPKQEPPKVAEKKEPEKPEEKKEPEKAPQQIELPKPDGRIAIVNDPSIDPNQEDNPDAHRIADNANKVKEESMARFRSYDQNASKPTGGGEPEPTDAEEPGNADQNERGFSVEAPGESDPRAGSEAGPTDPGEKGSPSKGVTDPGGGGQVGREADPGAKAREEGTGEASPSVSSADGGSWSISPDADGNGKPKQKGQKGRKATAAQQAIPGVPGVGLAPRYSINAYGLQEALGKEHLRKEEERARATRIAKHRGKNQGNQFEKYRAAIENYDPTVKPGNQTSLNAAKVPFASYINGMHNRIHPIFADGFLGGLNALPADDKLADLNLVAHAEIVLDGESGKVVRAGIVKTSGVTAFDAGAISAIYSAGPYGKPPDVILSSDGNVYLHWEFFRNPYYACTSKFARPYIVNVPAAKPTAPPAQKPSGSDKEKSPKAPEKPLRPEKKKS